METTVRAREFRNLKTAWLDVGQEAAPILLFLHGYPDSADTWSFQVEHFQKRFHVICPFSRGTGMSEATTTVERYGQNALTLDALQILEAADPTGKAPVVCVGHDLGVVTAWNLAQLLGERLKGLVVMNGLSIQQMLRRISLPAQVMKSWYIYAINVPYVSDFIASHFSDRLLKYAYSKGGLDSPLHPETENPTKNVVAPLNQYRAFTREIPKVLKQKPNKVKCPTLVLWGQRDAFVLPPTLEELEPYVTDVTVRILDGNHWIHRECANDVNDLLDGFLGELKDYASA